MKDAKTGNEHKISPSFQTQTTDVSTVQVITDPMTVQQSINTRHHLPTTPLVVQVYNPNILLIFTTFTPKALSTESINSWIINTNADDQQSTAVPIGTPETISSTSTKAGKPAGKTSCFSAIQSTI